MPPGRSSARASSSAPGAVTTAAVEQLVGAGRLEPVLGRGHQPRRVGVEHPHGVAAGRERPRQQPADGAAARHEARTAGHAAPARARCSRAARRTCAARSETCPGSSSTTVPTWLAGATSQLGEAARPQPGGAELRAAGLVAGEAVGADAARHAVGERDARAGRQRAGLDDAGQLVAEHGALDAGAVVELLDVGAAQADRGDADEHLAVARAAAPGRRAAPSRRRVPSTTARIRSTAASYGGAGAVGAAPASVGGLEQAPAGRRR